MAAVGLSEVERPAILLRFREESMTVVPLNWSAVEAARLTTLVEVLK